MSAKPIAQNFPHVILHNVSFEKKKKINFLHLENSAAFSLQVLSTDRPTSSFVSMSFNSVEETQPGSLIGSVRVGDRGTSNDGDVTYAVVGGTDRDGTFVVDRLTGDVYLARPLDYERDARYALQIEVDDFSQAPPSSTLIHLNINVQDGNDHAPEFPEDPVTIVISESAEPGSSVYTFQAVDKDGSGPNSELSYSIEHQIPDAIGLLSLDPSTGVLSLAQELDHEVTPELILVVKARDSAQDPSKRRWGSVTARVYVTDENDNAPAFRSPSAVSIMEDQPVGFVALYVMARDADQGENGRVTYSIQSGNTGGTFILNSNSGTSSFSFRVFFLVGTTPDLKNRIKLESFHNLSCVQTTSESDSNQIGFKIQFSGPQRLS